MTTATRHWYGPRVRGYNAWTWTNDRAVSLMLVNAMLYRNGWRGVFLNVCIAGFGFTFEWGGEA